MCNAYQCWVVFISDFSLSRTLRSVTNLKSHNEKRETAVHQRFLFIFMELISISVISVLTEITERTILDLGGCQYDAEGEDDLKSESAGFY